MDLPIGSSDSSGKLSYNDDENQKPQKYIYLGQKQYSHFTIKLQQQRNQLRMKDNQNQDKRVAVTIQPHSTMKYLKKKIGHAFEEFDEFKDLRGLRAKKLVKISNRETESSSHRQLLPQGNQIQAKNRPLPLCDKLTELDTKSMTSRKESWKTARWQQHDSWDSRRAGQDSTAHATDLFEEGPLRGQAIVK